MRAGGTGERYAECHIAAGDVPADHACRDNSGDACCHGSAHAGGDTRPHLGFDRGTHAAADTGAYAGPHAPTHGHQPAARWVDQRHDYHLQRPR